MLPLRVLLALSCALIGAGCASTAWQAVRSSPYYPDRLNIGLGASYNRAAHGWDKLLPGATFGWNLKPPLAPFRRPEEEGAP